MKERATIVWFKRDLRVNDHRPLVDGLTAGKIIPIYVCEPKYWHLPDTSARQWLFIRESLIELREEMASLGQPLIVRTGSVVDVFEDLSRRYDITAVHAHQETGNNWTYQRDLAVGRWCHDKGVAFREWMQFGVWRRLKDRDGWAKKWDKLMAERITPAPDAIPPIDLKPGDIPTAQDLKTAPDPCPERQKGGRRLGLMTLESFLEDRGQDYRTAMSSPVTGFDECSRMSPHIANGTVAMRECAQALWARQRELKVLAKDGADLGMWRGSMQSFSGRLHWHCHFMQKLEDAPSLEFEPMHPGFEDARPVASQSNQKYSWMVAWSEGQMGLPFADACMRALNATGYLNFRMRAMLMCLSSYHLWIDWREPGLLYAQKFTDYEAGIHWPQVQMQSGSTGINTNRIYNPVKQGYDQDPTGEFTRRWVPELEAVPDKYLQEPWEWAGAGEIIGKLYPERIVDHKQAARDARDKIRELKRSETFRAVAKEVYEKHGSRKRPSRRRKAKASA